MIIMGIDPGLATIGFGVLERQGAGARIIDYGIISTAAGIPLPQRLSIIYNDLTDLIRRYKPDAVAFEELFFQKNVKTALSVGHARGVCLIAANNILGNENLYEYTPLQIKQAVCGYGRADKLQVQQMVKALLNLDHIPKPDDAADALAVGICHCQSYRLSDEFRMK